MLILFGSYKGTVRRSGFFWANPFYARVRGKISGRWSADRSEGADEHGLADRAASTTSRCPEDLAARAQLQQREAQGQRQARQPDRDRRRHRLARRRHRAGRVRRRGLRELRAGAERSGDPPARERATPTTDGDGAGGHAARRRATRSRVELTKRAAGTGSRRRASSSTKRGSRISPTRRRSRRRCCAASRPRP